MENCQLAPASNPPMSRLGLLVRRSVPERPVSAARARLGAVGAVVSTVKAAKASRGALVFPAGSSWRTCTWPLA